MQPTRNRGLRITLVAGAIAGCLIAFFFIVTTVPDGSPILGSEVSGATEDALNLEATRFLAGKPDSGRLLVGWARSDITPPLGAPTYGYSSRLGRGISNVADSVSVRALAVSTGGGPPVVFLTAEICTWTETISDSISTAMARRFPGLFLYLGVTHTHNGPGGYANGPIDQLIMGGNDESLRETLIMGSTEAVSMAMASLSAASYRTLHSAARDLIMNRTQRAEPVDEDFLLLELRKMTGETCALVVFGAHATTMNDDSVVCSGDYPGVITRDLIRAGYSDAMFFSGATGQAGPSLDGKAVSGGDINVTAKYGELLANQLFAARNESVVPFREEVSIRTFASPINLPHYQYRISSRVLRHCITGWLFGSSNPAAYVRGIQIGENVFVSHSFEFSGVLAREIREEVEQSDRHLWITGFNGRNYLYVVPDHYYESPMYETSMSLFGPTLGSYLKTITVQLATMMFFPEESPEEPFDLSQ